MSAVTTAQSYCTAVKAGSLALSTCEGLSQLQMPFRATGHLEKYLARDGRRAREGVSLGVEALPGTARFRRCGTTTILTRALQTLARPHEEGADANKLLCSTLSTQPQKFTRLSRLAALLLRGHRFGGCAQS